MQAAIVIFPGSNCDHDVFLALKFITKQQPLLVWHEDNLPKADLVILPGGFSYGDYLRSGAIAARSKIMQEVVTAANYGSFVLGICNGFQILCEAGLLPGTLIKNLGQKFISKQVNLKLNKDFNNNKIIKMPIAHGDGNYFADEERLKFLEDNNLIALNYCAQNGEISDQSNPNGSCKNIAGLFSKNKKILGLMPHPERAIDIRTGSDDGVIFFKNLIENFL